MELLKLDERPAEFKWKDVTFYFRKRVTVGDKYEIDTAGTVMDGEKISFTPWGFYTTVIRIFVTGWDGVSDGGKAVPYSFETLMNRLPADTTEDLVMKLGFQIAKELGLVTSEPKQEGDLKNV